MGSLATFDAPQKLIDRANRAIGDAKSAFESLVEGENFTMVEEIDETTGEGVRKLVLLVPVPDIIEERITDAINNTRNAFDQILFAACASIDRPISDGHYPWASNPDDLDDWKLRNKKLGTEKIPREFWEVLRRQEPYARSEKYSGGDTLIRTMATFANRKHTVGVEVGCHITEVRYGRVVMQGGVGGASLSVPRWDPVKNEAILARWQRGGSVDFEGEHQFAFHIAFDSSAPRDLGAATEAITSFIQAAQRALGALKTRASELGAV